MWNSFIIAAHGTALLALFERNAGDLVSSMREALNGKAGGEMNSARLDALYASMHPIDFSRDILRGQETGIRVVRIPACGWTDLGTPKRVAAILNRADENSGNDVDYAAPAILSLAAQYERLRYCGA